MNSPYKTMATYQEQRERDYQNKLVKRFVDELHYKYLGNWQYAKGETVNSLGKQNSPILDDGRCSISAKKQSQTWKCQDERPDAM